MSERGPKAPPPLLRAAWRRGRPQPPRPSLRLETAGHWLAPHRTPSIRRRCSAPDSPLQDLAAREGSRLQVLRRKVADRVQRDKADYLALGDLHASLSRFLHNLLKDPRQVCDRVVC